MGAPMTGGGVGGSYVTSLLGALKKGSDEKRQRDEKKIFATAAITERGKEEAGKNVEALTSSGKTGTPEYEAAVQHLADANKEYADTLKQMQKFYQPQKAMWERMKDAIVRGVRGKPAQGPPQPAPQPVGVAQPGAVNAQPPDVYGAVARAQAKTLGEESEIARLQRQFAQGQLKAGVQAQPLQAQVNIGELQAKLRSQGATEEQAGGVAKIVTTHQMLSRGRIGLDDALRDVQDGAVRATDGKPGAGQQAALDLLERARLDPRFKDRIPEIDEKIAALSQGIAVRPGYAGRLAAPRYPTGTMANTFAAAQVPIKPYNQVTEGEWQRIYGVAGADRDLRKRRLESLVTKARQAGGTPYQQFNARTAGDRALIGRKESRIGQLQALLASQWVDLTAEDRRARNQELIDTHGQVVDLYENITNAYNEIYRPGTPTGGGGKPATEKLTPEGQRYLDGLKR